MRVRATVVLEFDDGRAETVTIDDLQVLGNWSGRAHGQDRAIWEVRRDGVLGVYQHHNVGVALLDLLRVAIIDINPDWCTFNSRSMKMSRPTAPTFTSERTSVPDPLRELPDKSKLDKILDEANSDS